MKKHDVKSILLVVFIGVLLISNAITLKLYIDTFNVNFDKLTKITNDEISEVQFFIKDWYDELRDQRHGSVQVFFNELRFKEGTYTLTVAADKIRATFPRGERYFSFRHVNYVEFYEDGERILCRVYYGNKGEYVFKVN